MEYSADDLTKLARDLINEAEKQAVTLRLLGGLAFYISSPDAARQSSLQRVYKDLDFVVNTKGAGLLSDIFARQGWEENRRFNALHGEKRMVFFHDEMQSDIFVGLFEQCHKLLLDPRLGQNAMTLSLADLLLTKLQIHQMNSKDVQDVYALLLSHDVASADHGQIDQDYILDLTSRDWGWYTTAHDNLSALLENSILTELSGDDQALIRSRLSSLKNSMETAEKSISWKIRNRIGRIVPWYDEPEEVLR